jgi:hypothetical protein
MVADELASGCLLAIFIRTILVERRSVKWFSALSVTSSLLLISFGFALWHLILESSNHSSRRFTPLDTLQHSIYGNAGLRAIAGDEFLGTDRTATCAAVFRKNQLRFVSDPYAGF